MIKTPGDFHLKAGIAIHRSILALRILEFRKGRNRSFVITGFSLSQSVAKADNDSSIYGNLREDSDIARGPPINRQYWHMFRLFLEISRKHITARIDV